MVLWEFSHFIPMKEGFHEELKWVPICHQAKEPFQNHFFSECFQLYQSLYWDAGHTKDSKIPHQTVSMYRPKQTYCTEGFIYRPEQTDCTEGLIYRPEQTDCTEGSIYRPEPTYCTEGFTYRLEQTDFTEGFIGVHLLTRTDLLYWDVHLQTSLSAWGKMEILYSHIHVEIEKIQKHTACVVHWGRTTDAPLWSERTHTRDPSCTRG